jgi:hypothetical protein
VGIVYEHPENPHGRYNFGEINEHESIKLKRSRDRSVGIALGYGLDDRGSRFRLPVGRLGIFLFTAASRTALGRTLHNVVLSLKRS